MHKYCPETRTLCTSIGVGYVPLHRLCVHCSCSPCLLCRPDPQTGALSRPRRTPTDDPGIDTGVTTPNPKRAQSRGGPGTHVHRRLHEPVSTDSSVLNLSPPILPERGVLRPEKVRDTCVGGLSPDGSRCGGLHRLVSGRRDVE